MGDDPTARATRDFRAPDGKQDADEENAFEALAEIEAAIEAIRKPDGSRKAPARTCKDLAMAHPDLPNAMYWIDPNQGSPVDAIEAFCDISSHTTCVPAKPSQVLKDTHYTGPQEHVWFGEEMDNGFPFTYKADMVQMKFLQLLSVSAVQNITYHCRNSVAYYDDAARNYKQAAKFMTSNDLELVARRPVKFRYDVLMDDCKYRADKWATTVFSFKTDKPQRLPILDIAPYDIGQANQAFGLEIGSVCFS
jgi:hypothetical protein